MEDVARTQKSPKGSLVTLLGEGTVFRRKRYMNTFTPLPISSLVVVDCFRRHASVLCLSVCNSCPILNLGVDNQSGNWMREALKS